MILCFPGLAESVPREFEALRLVGVNWPDSRPRRCDVSQMATRCHVSEGYVHAITPGGRKFLPHKCRLLLGREAFNFQSLWFPNPELLDSCGDQLLADLAGNAFEGSCCAAALLVTLGVLAHGANSRHPTLATPLKETDQADDADASGDDFSLDAIWGR